MVAGFDVLSSGSAPRVGILVHKREEKIAVFTKSLAMNIPPTWQYDPLSPTFLSRLANTPPSSRCRLALREGF